MSQKFIKSGSSKNLDFTEKTRKIKEINEKIEKTSKECQKLKVNIWQVTSEKEWLESENNRLTISSFLSGNFLKDLKSKYEHCKGTKIEKLLHSLIKSYETYHVLANTLRQCINEKEESLKKYQQITLSLSQESSLKSKISFLKDFSEEKEKTLSFLDRTLKIKRIEIEKAKTENDTSEVKKLLDLKEQYLRETSHCIENQNILAIEISKINQTIEFEKNVSTVTPEIGNKILKTNIADIENKISDTMKEIKIKEKQKEILKKKFEKLMSTQKVLKLTISHKNSRSMTGINTPKSKSDVTKSTMCSPLNIVSPNREQIIRLLNKGVDYKTSGRIEKALCGFGKQSLSMASKIVQLNRAVFSAS